MFCYIILPEYWTWRWVDLESSPEQNRTEQNLLRLKETSHRCLQTMIDFDLIVFFK